MALFLLVLQSHLYMLVHYPGNQQAHWPLNASSHHAFKTSLVQLLYCLHNDTCFMNLLTCWVTIGNALIHPFFMLSILNWTLLLIWGSCWQAVIQVVCDWVAALAFTLAFNFGICVSENQMHAVCYTWWLVLNSLYYAMPNKKGQVYTFYSGENRDLA